MSEAKQEQPPISVKDILGHYLIGDLTRSHEQRMMRMQRLGLSDEQLRETAGALKSDRQKIVELKLDDLTGLPRDKACRAIIEKALSDPESSKKVALGFNDFVYLHGMNQMIGHERTNDEVFKPIAKIYKELMINYHLQGKKVFIGRYAGDSFLIIIIGEEKKNAEGIFEEIVKTERQLRRPEGAAMRPTFSHGYAYSEEDEGLEAGSLIEKADGRCEENKRWMKKKIKRTAEKDPDSNAARFLEAVRRQ